MPVTEPRSHYKVHYITGLKNAHGDDTFACGRSQQMCALKGTLVLAEVTCRACLREIAKPFAE
jgi:hypothetical protein